METMLVPFYDVIDNEDLKVLSDLMDNRIGCCCKEASCLVALDASLKDFPDDPKEAFLEFFGGYLFFLTHEQAEELFQPHTVSNPGGYERTSNARHSRRTLSMADRSGTMAIENW